MTTDQKILNLLLRTELRPGESIIDNTDVTIAKELNLKLHYVTRITNNYFRNLKRKSLIPQLTT